MTSLRQRALEVADTIAHRLAAPDGVHQMLCTRQWYPQSLAVGAAGIALLHVERARTGRGSWRTAHEWLAHAAHRGIDTGPASNLYHGAPALAFVLRAASDDCPGAYTRALHQLDHHVARIVRARLADAHERLDRGDLPALAEFDAIRGLTGLGAYLLCGEPDGALMRAVLEYLVRLTEPVTHRGSVLPGWWTSSGPTGRPSRAYPGGHANNGVAHGIAGPLAMLSLARLRGVTVDGHTEAITRILAWLDRWRQPQPCGHAWPYWITRSQLDEQQPIVPPKQRPSWCYGTTGLARAQQLAALALGDLDRQRAAETALTAALSDPEQLATIGDLSLCHGHAGLALIAHRAAADAQSPHIGEQPLHLLASMLGPTDTSTEHVALQAMGSTPESVGLLEGAAGTALALQSVCAHDTMTTAAGLPRVRWDRFLLVA